MGAFWILNFFKFSLIVKFLQMRESDLPAKKLMIQIELTCSTKTKAGIQQTFVYETLKKFADQFTELVQLQILFI